MGTLLDAQTPQNDSCGEIAGHMWPRLEKASKSRERGFAFAGRTPDMTDTWRTLTAAAAEVGNAVVTGLVNPRTNEVYDLLEHRSRLLWVGSDSAVCAVVIMHPTVSRQQCSLEFLRDGRVVLTNHPRAKNKTRIEGQPVSSADLQFGTRISLGDVELTAFASLEEIESERAFKLFEEHGNYQAGAEVMGRPRKTFTRMVERAKLRRELAGTGSVVPCGIIRSEIDTGRTQATSHPLEVPIVDIEGSD